MREDSLRCWKALGGVPAVTVAKLQVLLDPSGKRYGNLEKCGGPCDEVTGANTVFAVPVAS